MTINLLYLRKSFVVSRLSPDSLFIFRNFGTGSGFVMVWFLKHSVSVLFFDTTDVDGESDLCRSSIPGLLFVIDLVLTREVNTLL